LIYPLVLLAFVLGCAWGTKAIAADPRFPDWPCVQIKVPEISVAAVWSGPSIDDVGDAWQIDPARRDLVGRLAARRTTLEAAQRAIAETITGNAAERQQKAKLIFAGLFATLNEERRQVMAGIERFFRRQKALAEQTRSEIAELRELQDANAGDQSKIAELADRVAWDTRIFDEQRKTISYACEVPVLIEQRLFALARMVERSLE
jgi:hypothetical protein